MRNMNYFFSHVHGSCFTNEQFVMPYSVTMVATAFLGAHNSGRLIRNFVGFNNHCYLHLEQFFLHIFTTIISQIATAFLGYPSQF